MERLAFELEGSAKLEYPIVFYVASTAPAAAATPLLILQQCTPTAHCCAGNALQGQCGLLGSGSLEMDKQMLPPWLPVK
ncbi:hypothetical protein cyc_06618 [Cyclospora cayetanensis]|uniref:Uncharacterized protein n=1 Tax=Cyclospora cayetanensis TaxID=88456 RepID=A0A1D3CSE6_9EIME|nr:hypothetical protein cyc_06618 [Cyclospora cayetanensis]